MKMGTSGNNVVQFDLSGQAGGACTQLIQPVPLNTWSHVAAWYNGLQAVLQVNGATTTPVRCTNGPVTPATGALYIGGDLTSGFSGSIDEVRIRTVAPPPLPSKSWGSTSMSGSFVTSNSIFTDIFFGANITLNVASSPILVTFNCAAANATAGNSTYFTIAVDGVASTYSTVGNLTSLFQPINFTVLLPVTPGNHVITAETRTTSGSVTVFSGSLHAIEQ